MVALVVNCIIFYLGLLNSILGVNGLTEVPAVEDVVIVPTEAVIRYTMNTLFHHLQLKHVRDKPKLLKYSIVHNNLISIALQDHDNLKEIAKLTRVDNSNITNRTESFMATINEILNEDNNVSNDVGQNNFAHDVNNDVMNIINDFLVNLEELKVKYHDVSHYDQSDINAEILKILHNDDHPSNASLSRGDYDDILMENEFWKPSGRRIFAGQRTNIKHFPFMASIQIMNQFHCAGSIIKSDLVISAASCLQLAYNNRFFRENPAFLAVRVGSSFFNGAGEKIPVLEVYFHPSYDPKTLRHNLCIMRILRRLRFSSRRVKKIDIDREPSRLPVSTDGITVVGWGPKQSSNIVKGTAIDQMSFSVLDYYPLDECREIYSREYVTETNFCAGFFSRGGGACNRDVGGPGIVHGVLTGVISFGSPICGAVNSPTVFVKVGFYAPWIDDILEKSVPYIKQRTTTTTPRNIFATIPKHTMPTHFTVLPIDGEAATKENIQILRELTNRTKSANTLSDEDEDPVLFKEFLKTLFGSKEVLELEESLANVPNNSGDDEKNDERDDEDDDDEDGNDDEIHGTVFQTKKVVKEPIIITETTKFMKGFKDIVLKHVKDGSQTSAKVAINKKVVSANSKDTDERKYTVMDKMLNFDAESESEKDIGRMNYEHNSKSVNLKVTGYDDSDDKSVEKVTKKSKKVTADSDSDDKSVEAVTEKSKRVTADNDSDDESVESVEIMLEVPKLSDIKTSTKPESTEIDDLQLQSLAEVAKSERLLQYINAVTKPSYTYMNDSMLTLLYLSDSDKKNPKLKLDSSDDNESEQVKVDKSDKIQSNDETYNLISQQDLYEILHEVLTSEAAKMFNKNKLTMSER